MTRLGLGAPESQIMVWFGRVLIDHQVLRSSPSTGPGCSKIHPAWAWWVRDGAATASPGRWLQRRQILQGNII